MPWWKAILTFFAAALAALSAARAENETEEIRPVQLRGQSKLRIAGGRAGERHIAGGVRARARVETVDEIGSPPARRLHALTLLCLVDASRRALLGRAVLEPQAAAVQTAVAARALRRIARRIIEVSPSSRPRARLGTLAHELLEPRPARE